MDTPILLALISTAGVFITGVASMGVAVVTNRKEKQTTADDAVDEASRQQLAAKDESIALRDEQLHARDERIHELEVKLGATQLELVTTQGELARAKDELRRAYEHELDE